MRKFLKNNKKNQRGVALIFALGILGLMVVLGLTFASLSFTDQTIARSSAEQEAAKIMAKSAVQRVIATLENNSGITDSDQIISSPASNHYDFLWKLITYHGEVPGAGEMQKEVEKRVQKLGTQTPRWQYVKNNDDEIVGRFAYLAYQPVGLLDPFVTARTNSEASASVERYGMKLDEIDLKVLSGVSVSGGSGTLTDDDIKSLGEKNSNETVSPAISKPNDLFERFSAQTQSDLNTRFSHNALKDHLTSAWFSVPRTPASPDRFLFKDSAGAEKYYHRFNLNRKAEEWVKFTKVSPAEEVQLTVDKLMAKDAADLVEYDESAASKDPNAGVAIPWFKKADDDTRQIAANFLAYFSPIPKNLMDQKLWSVANNTAVYTANMRTPYLNDVMLHVKLNMVVTDAIDGNTDAVTYKKVFTVKITPEIDVYVELADLYKNSGNKKSLESISELTFNMNLLKSLSGAASFTAPSGVTVAYDKKDMLNSNTNLKNVEFTITNPKDGKFNNGTGVVPETFPVFKETILAANPYTTTITVVMTKPYNEADGTYGEATCSAVKFSEPLESFIVDKINLMLSAKFNGRTEKIPIDLSNISNEKSIPVLGKEIPPSNTTSEIWAPFQLNINDKGDYEDATQQTQERHIVLRYRAIDSAANLKLEHWVESTPEFFKEMADITNLASYPGFNNYAELKSEGRLSFTKNDNLDYNTIKVKINETEEKEFFVDKETDHEDKNAVAGYGAVLSTSYIRGKVSDTTEILSPWEIGFIHRGAPYQTLNIKKFNPNASEIGKYEDGDANIFDYLKVVQKENDGTVTDENKIHTRGLVNLQKISRQGGNTEKSGNLPAAWAVFSNIGRGWTISDNGDDTFKKSGTTDWNDSLAKAKEIVTELAKIVDTPNFVLTSRAAILDSKYSTLKEKLIVGDNDAAQEELIGRFVMLTTADTTKSNQFSDFLVVTAIAQRIQISQVLQIDKPVNDETLIESGYAYRKLDKSLWKFATLPSEFTNPNGAEHKGTFYPGYDKILSTQKVIAWLRKNSNGKWYIERLDYVD